MRLTGWELLYPMPGMPEWPPPPKTSTDANGHVRASREYDITDFMSGENTILTIFMSVVEDLIRTSPKSRPDPGPRPLTSTPPRPYLGSISPSAPTPNA